MNIESLEVMFENCILKLNEFIYSKGSDYFFTEKEIHSYFYHLCQNAGVFGNEESFYIHTEYPTPFKCLLVDQEPFIVLKDNTSNYLRAHIDLVFINPNFMNWVKYNNIEESIIYGLAGIKSINFSEYITQYNNVYGNYMRETNEPIILYAIEFKFIRHFYDSIKMTIKNIKQDIEKLKLISNHRIYNYQYCKNVRSIVYIGKRFSSNTKNIELDKLISDECSIHYV